MRTLLRVEHLTKDFSTHGGETYRAVDDVSFSLGFHEKMAVIGESGSGKTTLARMITRRRQAVRSFWKKKILRGQKDTI